MAFEGVWLIHPENGVHKVPNDPNVIAYFKGRDYEVTDLPSELDSDDPDFIEALDKLQAEKVSAKATKSATKSKKEDE